MVQMSIALGACLALLCSPFALAELGVLLGLLFAMIFLNRESDHINPNANTNTNRFDPCLDIVVDATPTIQVAVLHSCRYNQSLGQTSDHVDRAQKTDFPHLARESTLQVTHWLNLGFILILWIENLKGRDLKLVLYKTGVPSSQWRHLMVRLRYFWPQHSTQL